MNNEKYSITADFLKHSGRRLFYLLLEPTDVPAHTSVLFLHPFAEEMHKSRRTVSSQARALAAAGYTVMLLDLSGSGDSSGDFSEASWEIWLEDAGCALDTLMKRSAAPVTLWGLRLGALLAGELSQGRNDLKKLILWQPVLSGEQQIDQFLRLETAGLALNSHVTFDRNILWNELRSGRSLEIAGYELSSTMVLEMAKSRLKDMKPGCPVAWIEIGNLLNNGPSTGSQSAIAHWQDTGVELESTQVQGSPFWRISDAVDSAALETATLKAFG
jgi:exosortase A-associated hydrolase 2